MFRLHRKRPFIFLFHMECGTFEFKIAMKFKVYFMITIYVKINGFWGSSEYIADYQMLLTAAPNENCKLENREKST